MTTTPSANHISVTSGFLSLEFLGHDSVEAFDQEAGEPGYCLETADRYWVNRETIDRFDRAITPWLEEVSGVARTIDKEKTALELKRRGPGAREIIESWATYLRRIEAKVSPETLRVIKAECLVRSQTFRISCAPVARLAPVEPMFYKRAASVLSGNQDTIDTWVSRMLAVVPDFELGRDSSGLPNKDSFARLFKRYAEAQISDED